MNLLACRLCLCSAAWRLAATSVAACVAAVTAAVEDVNHGLERARTRNFMCPPRTWRLSCSLTREVRLNHLCRHSHFESVRGGSMQTLKMFCLCLSSRGWGRPYNAATISHRDDTVNIGWALLLPHWHRLQLTLRSRQSWPAALPASLLHLSEIKEKGNPSFHFRTGAMRRRGTSKHGPWKELMKSHPLNRPRLVHNLFFPPVWEEKRNS